MNWTIQIEVVFSLTNHGPTMVGDKGRETRTIFNKQNKCLMMLNMVLRRCFFDGLVFSTPVLIDIKLIQSINERLYYFKSQT